MGDAQTGAKTDVTHDVWTGCTDDAWTGAMTDIMGDVQMGCTDDAWTGALKGVTYDVLTVGDFTRFSCREFTAFSPHNYRGVSMGLVFDHKLVYSLGVGFGWVCHPRNTIG